jgi:hypothetical protein
MCILQSPLVISLFHLLPGSYIRFHIRVGRTIVRLDPAHPARAMNFALSKAAGLSSGPAL